MARPFILVSQQDADNDHQILEQLLEQLYQIIRQIILRRGRIVAQQPVPLPNSKLFFIYFYVIAFIFFDVYTKFEHGICPIEAKNCGSIILLFLRKKCALRG